MIPLLLSSLSTFVQQLRSKDVSKQPAKIEEVITIPALRPVWELGQDSVSGRAFTLGMEVVMIISKVEQNPETDRRVADAAHALLDVIESYTYGVSTYLKRTPSMQYVRTSSAPGAVWAREVIADYEDTMRAIKRAIGGSASRRVSGASAGTLPNDDALKRCGKTIEDARQKLENIRRLDDIDGDAPDLLPPSLLADEDDLSTIAPTESSASTAVDEVSSSNKARSWKVSNDPKIVELDKQLPPVPRAKTVRSKARRAASRSSSTASNRLVNLEIE